MCARARLRPRLLFGARTGRIDPKPDALARCEIDCGDAVDFAARRDVATRNRSAISVAMRRTRICNRLARENRPDRARAAPEQCRNFV